VPEALDRHNVAGVTDPLSIQLSDGRTLAFAEYGTPDGDALFFFHGLPGSRGFSAMLADDARAVGLRIVAPDRPGFGASTFAPDRTFSSWAADVEALADHLGIDRFYVAGISGGGPYTLAAAHGLGTRVRSAGVISGGGDMSDPSALEGMHEQNRDIFQVALDGGREAVAVAAKPMLDALQADPDAAEEASMAGMPPQDLELLKRRPDSGEALRADGLAALAQGVDGLAYEVELFVKPWDFDVSEITAPVVLWHGDDDRNAPLSHAQALAAQIPHAELIVWTGMGHLTAIDRMQEIFGHLIKVGS
jgi:pimeloyl-ACP methyl ester carboxylesterase